MNSGPWPFDSKTAIPHAGVWTFDYVHKIKPPADAVAMDDSEFMKFIGVRFDVIDAIDAVGSRDGNYDNSVLSPSDIDRDVHENDEILHSRLQPPPQLPSPCDWQRVPSLTVPGLQNDLHERARDVCTSQWLTLRQSMMLVKRIGSIYLQIDIIVSLWPRIIDWHGFDQVRSKSLKISKLEPFMFLTTDAASGDASC
jgi:hypothetical protein